MAEFTRTNGAGFDHGVQYSVANLTIMEVDALVDLTSKDGLGGAIETIAREFQPLLYKSNGTAGKIAMVVDGHSISAADMQIRLRDMGTVDGVTLTSATVTEVDFNEIDFT